MRGAVKFNAIALCALLAASCSSPESKARKEIVNGCLAAGASKDQCDCAYNKLSNYYGEQAMVRMSKGASPPDDFVEATMTAGLQCSTGDTSSKLVLSSSRSGSSSPATQTESRVPSQDDIETLISSRAKAASGAEYRDGRHVKSGDVTGDGIPDEVILFTIEVASENTVTQYLAVIAGSGGAQPFETDETIVGGAGQNVEAMHVDGGEIKVELLSPGPDDPECCPSIRSTVEYIWHNGKIKRVS